MMLPTVRVTGIVEPDGDDFHGYCPELPEVHTCGDTAEEAWQMLDDAIRLVLEDRAARGEPLPLGQVQIRTLDVSA